MENTREQQFVRLNKDIDILMNAGDYEGAIERLDKALVLCKEIANRTNDYKKISLMKSNFSKLQRKKEICEEHLGIKTEGNAMQKPKASNQTVKKAMPKPKVKAEPLKRPSLNEALAELNNLVGLEKVKDKVNSFVKQIQIFQKRKDQGMAVPKTSYHMVFTGNPGTGKTTVARIMGDIYTALGIVSGNEEGLVETQRNDLVAGYVGQTAIKTQEVIDRAIGGVLFIDEAYTLAPKGGVTDFGQEAIDTILKGMEDHRDNIAVIAAGYEEEMKRFIDSNPGLRSRFKTFINFEDYHGEQLYKIFTFQCKKNQYKLSAEAESKLKKFFKDYYENRDENFGNARDVRNIFESIIETQAQRLAEMPNPTEEELETIILEDLNFLD